jgi:RHS repeat-associated protein
VAPATGSGRVIPARVRPQTSQTYYHRNQQYSIVGLTNAAGTLVERYTSSAYGTLGIYAANGAVRSSSTYANRYTYTGQEWDAELRLHHFRARWYDPATGGFVSRDPLGYVDGMSHYRGYFASSAVDPTGYLTWSIDKANCTITMNYAIEIRFRDRYLYTEYTPIPNNWAAGTGAPGAVPKHVYDRWTVERETSFRNGLRNSIESIFNSNSYQIKPKAATCCIPLVGSAGTGAPGVVYGMRTVSCPCPNGFSPRVNVSFVEGWADWTVYATANSEGVFIRSSVSRFRWYGYLDEADVEGVGHTAAHEFGHSIWLDHPGSWLGDEYYHSGEDYWGREVDGYIDLMGAGTGLRPFYFDKWVTEINSREEGCCRYAIR